MNEEKFTGRAELYAKYRPTYPDALIDYLYGELGFSPQSVLADIGSGTGILTELLLQRESSVFAVEPNPDMRRAAELRLGGFANFHSINATAEQTGLADASVDHITVAQAFHWFDRQRFKAECGRIAKPGGTVVLIWNSRDMKSGLVMENDAINRRYCERFVGFSGGLQGEEPEEYADFFKTGRYGICRYTVFRHDLIFDEEGFIGRNLSASYSPTPDEEAYGPYVAALRQLFVTYSKNGTLVLPNLTRCYAGEV